MQWMMRRLVHAVAQRHTERARSPTERYEASHAARIPHARSHARAKGESKGGGVCCKGVCASCNMRARGDVATKSCIHAGTEGQVRRVGWERTADVAQRVGCEGMGR